MSKKPAPSKQPTLFDSPSDSLPPSKFIANYRVALVRDRSLPFEPCRLTNSQQAQPIIRKLIEAHGQSDREQFCVILLNVKNEIIGLNIVATGTISSAQVSPREVLKPAILANSAAIILCHHPSGDVYPDGLHIYRESGLTYVLTVNFYLEYAGLEVFDGEEAVGEVFLQGDQVREVFPKENLAPFTMIRRLMPYIG